MNTKLYILPQPQQMEPRPGTFMLYRTRGIVLMPEIGTDAAIEGICASAERVYCGGRASQATGSGQLYAHARLLQTSVVEATGIHIPVMTDACCDHTAQNIYLAIDASLDAGVYTLEILADAIRVTGHGATEVLYGIQTLRQIISQQGAHLSGLFVHDFPELAHRGFYHDVTRGRVPKLESLKRLADRCSYYKINELQLYIEHTYLFKGCSEMWRDETPLTAEEIMEFDRYCQGLGIDLIPSISTFGHLYKLLETRTFAPLCELESGAPRPFSFFRRMRHHTLDASNPQSLELMLARIDEYMSLFSSKYFNICADETFDIGLGKTRGQVEALGREEVYIRFVKALCEHVASRGKIPMFWGDIIVSRPEKIAVLPKETICLNWGYAPDQDDAAVHALKNAGATQYLCPGVQGWTDFINIMPDAYANISAMCRYAYENGISGILNTDWGDTGHVNHPDFSEFGLICGAAFSWNSHIPDYETLCRHVSVVAYKDPTETVMKCLSDISTQGLFRWLFVDLFMELATGTMADEPQLEQQIRSRLGDALNALSDEALLAANERLRAETDRLAGYLGAAPGDVKRTLNYFINAAEGQMLFNEIALYIPRGKTAAADSAGRPALRAPSVVAEALETWFMDYKNIWRESCKEGDLGHIQEIINWYGDYLRTSTPIS